MGHSECQACSIRACYASSNSTNTPPQSLGCKNTTGLPWAPICVKIEENIEIFKSSQKKYIYIQCELIQANCNTTITSWSLLYYMKKNTSHWANQRELKAGIKVGPDHSDHQSPSNRLRLQKNGSLTTQRHMQVVLSNLSYFWEEF